PRRRLAAGAGKPLVEVGETALVGDHRELRTSAPRDLRQRLAVGRRGHCNDFEPLGRALDQVQRRLADRAGRTEDCQLAPHVSPTSCAAAVSTATGTNPSSRSSTPPWPGSHAPESLRPARRFIPLSNRSPACAARAKIGASSSSAGPRCLASTQAPPISAAAAIPPTSPSMVFPGLIDGASLRCPKRRPLK